MKIIKKLGKFGPEIFSNNKEINYLQESSLNHVVSSLVQANEKIISKPKEIPMVPINVITSASR